MALPATDAFTNSNGTSLTAHSGSWTAHTGAFVINSNQLASNAASSDTLAFWNADTFDNDQYAQATVTALSSPTQMGLAVRIANVGTKTFYGIAWDDVNLYFFKYVDGAGELFDQSAAPSVGDVMRIEAEGTTIRVLKNGSASGAPSPVTDTSIASGPAGITGYNNATSNRIDNWEGGNLGGVAANIIYQRRMDGLGAFFRGMDS